MNDEFSLSEEERVGLDLPGCINNFLHFLFGEIRQVVNELPLVCTVWDYKAELEGVISDDASSKVMAFDHLHFLDWFWSDPEHHG